MLDGKDRILTPVSQSLAGLFRRQEFSEPELRETSRTRRDGEDADDGRNHIAALLGGTVRDPAEANPLSDVDVRLTNADGTFDSAHYGSNSSRCSSQTSPRAGWSASPTSRRASRAPGSWRTCASSSRFRVKSCAASCKWVGRASATFMQKADGSMKTIAKVLKKPAREEDAFRHKLDEILDEVDRVRREAAAFKLTGLESAARIFEDALHELRNRAALSGSDFLPLAVKLDQLYNQFALIKSLTIAAEPAARARRTPRRTCA